LTLGTAAVLDRADANLPAQDVKQRGLWIVDLNLLTVNGELDAHR